MITINQSYTLKIYGTSIKSVSTSYKKVVTILLNIFKEKFNISNSTIILNRICELLVTNEELFNTLEKPKTLKK